MTSVSLLAKGESGGHFVGQGLRALPSTARVAEHPPMVKDKRLRAALVGFPE